MLKDTRLHFNAYLAHVARQNGIEDARESFSVTSSVQQKVIEVIQQSSAFLQKIAFETVVQQEGDKVGVGVTRPIAGRVNTRGGTRRSPTDPTDTYDKGRYRCEQTFYDHSIPWEKLDAWRHKPNFAKLISDVITKRHGLDRISIGWHGTSTAATTDKVANPRLSDVNLGWLHKIRTYAPSQVLDDGALTSTGKAIYVSDTGAADYKTLDALAFDVSTMLAEWYQEDEDLVCITSRDLVHDKFMPVVNTAGNKASEMLARDAVLRGNRQLGGYLAERAPSFPTGSLLITSYANLAIYEQEDTRRRYLKDEPELTQIVNYELVNESFVVEDYDKCVLVENIVMGPRP